MSENIDDSVKPVETVETRQPKKKRKHTSRKILFTVLGIIVGLVLFVLLFVSPIAKWYVEKHDTELIGRELSINRLRINLLAGSVNLGGITLYEDDAKTSFVSFDNFKTGIKLRDLLDNRLWVNYLNLEGLNVNVIQNDSIFNFTSLINHFASDEPKEEKESSSNFGLIFNDINISESVIRYNDVVLGSDIALRNIALNIPFIDLTTLNSDVGLDLSLPDGGLLHTKINLSENAESYKLNLKINNLNIPIFEPYLKNEMALDSIKGKASLDLNAEGLTDHILEFDLNGFVRLWDISAQDLYGHQLGMIDTIDVDVRHFSAFAKELELNRLSLYGIRTQYIIAPTGRTIFDNLTMQSTEEFVDTLVEEITTDTIFLGKETLEDKTPFRILVDDLQLADIDLVYEDNTLPEPFHYEVEDLSVKSRDFNMDGFNSVMLSAKLNKLGELKAFWKGNPRSLNDHNLTLTLRNLKLSDFSSYCIKMFGFPLENGTLAFESQNVVETGELKGINKLQLADPIVGDRIKSYEPDMKHIPLKLGMYCLTDKNHKVALDLPVAGNINDPKFSYKKAVLQVLGDLMVKIVTSPFPSLSKDGNVSYMPIDLTANDFTAADYSHLDEIAASLLEHPNMKVDFELQQNYEKAINLLSLAQLKRDFYLSQHPEQNAQFIDLLTNINIHNINNRDERLLAFAAQFNEGYKVKPRDLEAVAAKHYETSSAQLLNGIMDRRNALLIKYLNQTKGVPMEQINVFTADLSTLKMHKKDSRYVVSVNIDEMEIEMDETESSIE